MRCLSSLGGTSHTKAESSIGGFGDGEDGTPQTPGCTWLHMTRAVPRPSVTRQLAVATCSLEFLKVPLYKANPAADAGCKPLLQ